MTLYYCDNCGKRVPSRIEEREETFPVRGEPTTVTSRFRTCEVCGGGCSDNELLDETLRKAFDQYRKRHNIITPEEIKELRERYGLSQRNLAILLGWGEVTITRYENGGLPDMSHNRNLRMLGDFKLFEDLFRERRDYLPERAGIRLETRLEELRKGIQHEPTIRFPFQNYPVGQYTGYRRFSKDALEAMILYFTIQGNGVLKTKLLKQMWYADFLHFRQHAVSMSGTAYVKLPHGPAADDYESILSELKLTGVIDIEETIVGGYPGYNIKALAQPDLSCLPPGAERILAAVHAYFQSFSSSSISELSHAEIGYVETEDNQPISYDYADNLKVNIPIDST